MRQDQQSGDYFAALSVWFSYLFGACVGWTFWDFGAEFYLSESQSPVGTGKVLLRRISSWDGDSFDVYVRDNAGDNGSLQEVATYGNISNGFSSGRFVWSGDGSVVARWDKYSSGGSHLFTAAYDFRDQKSMIGTDKKTSWRIRALLTQRGGIRNLVWSPERKIGYWEGQKLENAGFAKASNNKFGWQLLKWHDKQNLV